MYKRQLLNILAALDKPTAGEVLLNGKNLVSLKEKEISCLLYTSELAGKAVVFKVKLHEIYNEKEAELNDEFAASLNFPEVQSVEDLSLIHI